MAEISQTGGKVSLNLDDKSLADCYDRISGNNQFKAGLTLVEKLHIAPCEHVLDIGAGTGLLTAYVAGLVGPNGRVIGIDPLQDRVDISREREQQNLSFEVGDAQDLSRFSNESFDVVLMNSVLHWVADKAKALDEIIRVLKPGGRLGISGGSGDHTPPYRKVRARVLAGERYKHYADTAAATTSTAMPKLLQREGLDHLLTTAGFVNKKIELIPMILMTENAKALSAWAQASSFGNFVGHLPKGLREEALAEMEIGFQKYSTPEGIKMELQMLVSVATKT